MVLKNWLLEEDVLNSRSDTVSIFKYTMFTQIWSIAALEIISLENLNVNVLHSHTQK